ncbi:MAG: lactate utilization protein, partial [archaeon]
MSDKWPNIPDEKTISHAIEAIKSRGIEVFLADSKKEALEKLISLIPKGAEIMNGTSTTLQEIGFVGFLKSGKHGWKNLQEEILKEKDMAKQMDLRRKSVTAEYFLGSVNAIAKSGELVACDASGSRVTAYPFAAKNLILVVGIQKIAKSLEEAMKRIREY